VETINREFEEETGTSLIFSNDEDFCFSYIDFIKPIEIRMTSTFCRTTSDLKFFNSILSNFHSGTHLVVVPQSDMILSFVSILYQLLLCFSIFRKFEARIMSKIN
jgi:hypothetical protein